MNRWIMRLNHWVINLPYIDPTSTSHRPSIDPTSTLHRPYIDPTSTLHRPYIDPTSHRYVAVININVFKPFIHGHLWLNFQSVNMTYKHKRNGPLCNKTWSSIHTRSFAPSTELVFCRTHVIYVTLLWSFCEALPESNNTYINILGYQYLRISIS
jgi:hypothetical protein